MRVKDNKLVYDHTPRNVKEKLLCKMNVMLKIRSTEFFFKSYFFFFNALTIKFSFVYKLKNEKLIFQTINKLLKKKKLTV